MPRSVHSGYNNCTFMGNLTSDPEVFTFATSAKTVGTIAVNRAYKTKEVDSDNKPIYNSEVTYIPFEAWGPTGDWIANRLKKGYLVQLHGQIQQSNWEDKETGVKRSKHFLKVAQAFGLDERIYSNGSNPQDDTDISFNTEEFESEEEF